MTIPLPTQKSQVNRNFKDQKFGMLGMSGIGKSAFWSQEPNALFIDTEGGLNALEVYKLPARSWEDVGEIYLALKEAKKEGKFSYTVIAIDTIDNFVSYAAQEVVNKAQEFYKKAIEEGKLEISTIGDVPNGNGWVKTTELVMKGLDHFKDLGCAVVFIGHLKNKKIKDPHGEYDKMTIDIFGSLGTDLVSWVDHCLYIDSQRMGEKLQRVCYTLPTQSREAKSRGGIIPSGARWGDDMGENYANFRKLFI